MGNGIPPRDNGKIAPKVAFKPLGGNRLGRHRLKVNHWRLQIGGHCRTGRKDNIRYNGNRLARSNAELVERVAGLCAEYAHHPASRREACLILGLAPMMAET
ncbi:MAG: 3-keto-5-aminohexanoate cleavage protein [Nitratireductor sp.]|nr:3-keto-5-aminohexanoate cleavage protein [Nitratireductor sp.]